MKKSISDGSGKLFFVPCPAPTGHGFFFLRGGVVRNDFVRIARYSAIFDCFSRSASSLQLHRSPGSSAAPQSSHSRKIITDTSFLLRLQPLPFFRMCRVISRHNQGTTLRDLLPLLLGQRFNLLSSDMKGEGQGLTFWHNKYLLYVCLGFLHHMQNAYNAPLRSAYVMSFSFPRPLVDYQEKAN